MIEYLSGADLRRHFGDDASEQFASVKHQLVGPIDWYIIQSLAHRPRGYQKQPV